MWWWWWAWVAVLFFLLLVPLTFGWSRRGWGPPYPTYYRRRYYRGRAAPMAPEPPVPPDHAGVPPVRSRTAIAERRELASSRQPGGRWSWLADLFWLGVFAAIAWAIYIWAT